jgi:glutamyl-tRNA synthetase
MESDAVADWLRTPLENAGLTYDAELTRKVAPLVKPRMKTFNDVVELAGFFFADPAQFTPAPAADVIQKKMDAAASRRALDAALAALEGVEPFTAVALLEHMTALGQELGLSNSQFFGVLRVAVSAQKVSTPTFETMEVLGKSESLRRIALTRDSLTE